MFQYSSLIVTSRLQKEKKLPLQDAEQGHAAVAKGGAGKLLLFVDKERERALSAKTKIPVHLLMTTFGHGPGVPKPVNPLV
jgi:hypothetical protein